MWSRDNDGNTNQKGMNFASVAAAGSASANSSLAPAQYLDTTPPQVDVSKAPGYRKNTTCSPVSSKPCSTTSSPPSSNVEAAAPSPVKPPSLLAISRPGPLTVDGQGHGQGPSVSGPPTSAGQPMGQPSPGSGLPGPMQGPMMRPSLEIQPPDVSMGLTVNRPQPMDMQHSPGSGLAVQRPNKDGPGVPGQQPLASPIPLPHRQATPPQMGHHGLAVQRPSMVDMQHSPSRSSSSVEMPSPQGQQGGPQGPQGPQGQVQAQGPPQGPPGPPPNTSIPPPAHHNHMMRPMSMEIPPSGALNHNMVVRPNSMVDGMVPPGVPPGVPQPQGPQQQQQPPQAQQGQAQQNSNQSQPPVQQQRLDMPPTDFGVRSVPVYQDDSAGLYSAHAHTADNLLGMVPGMTDALLNTAVSMSRLNPRAPDFSSAMHHTNKPPPHPPMFQSAPPYLPPTMLPPGPLPNKFHPPRPGHGNVHGHGPSHGPSTHNRWPFMPPGPGHAGHGYQPDPTSFNVLGGALDMMPPMAENGNSPPSPNHGNVHGNVHGHVHGHGHGHGHGGDPSPMKAPPRPIGTERHFKHSMGGDGVTGADWLLGMPQQQQNQQPPQADHKMSWAGPQMFRSNPPPYDLPPMDTFQVSDTAATL